MDNEIQQKLDRYYGEDTLALHFEATGLTPAKLIELLNDEVRANVTKHVKLKGNVKAVLDPRVTIVAKSTPADVIFAVPDEIQEYDPLSETPPPPGALPVIVDETLLLIEEPDHSTRLKAITDALKLQGYFRNTGEEIPTQVFMEIVQFSEDSYSDAEKNQLSTAQQLEAPI